MLAMSLAAVVLLSYIDVARGYGSGAPNQACETMIPGHNVDAQSPPSPYSLTLPGDESYYGGKSNISVKITGSTFRGVLLQARTACCSDYAYGSFTVSPSDNMKTTNCNGTNNTATHSFSANKEDIIVVWHPPQQDVGALRLVGTVAKEKNTFWLNHESKTLLFTAAKTTTRSSITVDATVHLPTTTVQPAETGATEFEVSEQPEKTGATEVSEQPEKTDATEVFKQPEETGATAVSEQPEETGATELSKQSEESVTKGSTKTTSDGLSGVHASRPGSATTTPDKEEQSGGEIILPCTVPLFIMIATILVCF